MTVILCITIALAIARLTLIITRDDIFQPIRERIFIWSPPENDERKGWYYQNFRPQKKRPWRVDTVTEQPYRPPGFIGEVISCPDCCGVWVAVGYLSLYSILTPLMINVSYVLAAAMVVSLIARKY